ncbi:MAG: DUF3667 domain-containing protein [Erythrobacter sp.]
MSDITEGLGSAIEGSMVSRAVEPNHGKDGVADSDAATTACLNCGAIPTGGFCQDCGQKTHIHRSIAAIGHDLIHGVLHLDGKLWRTLPLLAFKPGKLTRRYIDGERAKFVSPMAMFLFSVFLMFAVFQAVGFTAPTNLEDEARSQVDQQIAAESKRVTDQLTKIDASLEREDLSAAERTDLEAQRESLQEDLVLLDTRGANIGEWLASNGSSALDGVRSDAELNLADARERLAAMEEGTSQHTDLAAEIAVGEQSMAEVDQFEEQATEAISTGSVAASDFDIGKTGIGWIDQAVKKWRSNPSLMLYKMQANAYKFSWLLIPLSIPFVWFVFAWKRRFKAYDHAIFVTYSIAFMSLFFLTLSVLGRAGVSGALLTLTSFIVPPVHIYKQLRTTYGIGRFGAIWRLVFLLFIIVLVIILFMQSLLVLGAF